MSQPAESTGGRPVQTEKVEHIPVIWVEPDANSHPRRLALFLPHFTGTKEKVRPQLEDLAADGFVAMSFDPWQHGERGSGETPDEMVERVFAAFRRRFWPILGQTTLDVLRVIDWAIDTLAVEPAIRVGGLSMGGDVAVAAAGIDRRIERVAAVVSTPDWLRPGMRDLSHPERLLEPGEPDSYARWFYDQLNPLTHVGRYGHGLALKFWCGERDTQVPADGALRFQAEVRDAFSERSGDVQVDMLPGLAHMDVRDPARWWPDCREWLAGP